MQAHQHTYFLNPNEAVEMAEQNNTILDENYRLQPQVCYYDGKPLEETLPTLVNVPIENFEYFFSRNSLPLPTMVQDGKSHTSSKSHSIHNNIAWLVQIIEQNRAHLKSQKLFILDTLFADINLAYLTALQQNRVPLSHPTIDGLQICYYLGNPHNMEIPNLIALNPDKFIEFFTTTRLRMPKHFIFPASLPMDSIKQSSESLLSLTKQVLKTREHTIHELLNECIHITPTPVVDGKYHIFLPASRLTQVMQYASKGIADALERNGHHVELIIEANEMEQIETYHILSAVKELNPHITISINHLNNAYISPNVFNIVWWQDPMPSLVDPNSKFEWRPRDLPYASSNGLANLVSQKGATNVKIQPFCVDQTIFNYNSSNERSEKVVFVGSSNSVQLNRFPPAIVDEIINRIEPAIDQSGVLDLETQLITEFKSRINIAEQEFSFIISYLIRNISVRWLCQCDSIEVEIYGRHWQDNPIVSPFFKRELQHGSELASIYNSAKYAFVPTQPMDINTQRLAEAAACGCIPILTDRRKHSAKPHWDDHCLFFNKKAELSQCFTKIPKRPAHEIADFFSYEHFANEIIQSVNNFEIENKLEGIIAS